MTDVKQEQGQMPSQMLNALMAVNKISYVMPPEIGITRKVTHQEDVFQAQTYTGGEMLLIAQTGSSFVNPYKSWLKFSTTVTDTGTQTYGRGSFCNFFNEILVESRTGTDISRLRQANLFIKYYQDWVHSPCWKSTEGQTQRYPAKTDFKEDGASGNIVGTVTTSCVRVSDLIACFRPLHGKLLPPQFMEGLRLRIILASKAQLGPASAVPNGTYAINNPRVQWHVTSLNDSFRRKIQEISSTRGLVVMYKEVHQQSKSIGLSTDVNIEINKSVSKALRAWLIPRLTANVTPIAADQDPFTTTLFNWKNIQSRVGNDYFPQKPLESSGATDFMEFYTYCLHSMGYENPQEAPVVPPTTTAGGYGSVDVKNSASPMIFSYNRSSTSDLDGYVINNSRSLLYDLTLLAPNATAARVDTFVEFLRVALVFSANIDIKD